MNNQNNLLDLFNTVGSIFNALSKIKVSSKNISDINKLVTDNKKTILTGSALIAGTATVTTAINNKNTNKKVKNSFVEGVKKGEIETKKKFNEILITQKQRDEFLLLMTKICSHISKIDGDFSVEEKSTIDSFIGKINFDSPSTHEFIKNELENIINSSYDSNSLIQESVDFLNNLKIDRKHYVNFMNQIMIETIESDGIKHELEMEFYEKWRKEVNK